MGGLGDVGEDGEGRHRPARGARTAGRGGCGRPRGGAGGLLREQHRSMSASDHKGDGRPPVETAEPSKALGYVIGPVMGALLRSLLHWLVSRHLMLLIISGRRTGKRYEVVVGRHELGDVLVVPSAGKWRFNLRGGVPVEVMLGAIGRKVARKFPGAEQYPAGGRETPPAGLKDVGDGAAQCAIQFCASCIISDPLGRRICVRYFALRRHVRTWLKAPHYRPTCERWRRRSRPWSSRAGSGNGAGRRHPASAGPPPGPGARRPRADA